MFDKDLIESDKEIEGLKSIIIKINEFHNDEIDYLKGINEKKSDDFDKLVV